MQSPLRPLHAVFLAGTVPLYLGVLLADLAYFNTYEVQWKNFASWLLVGALVFGGLTLLPALLERIRDGWHVPAGAIHFGMLLVSWILGFLNAFVHAGDAWASMPEGLVLSVIVVLLMIAATWSGFSRTHAGNVR